jgi:hypothetical protein
MVAGQVLERPFDALVGFERGEFAVAMLERMLATRFLVVSSRVERRRRGLGHRCGDVLYCCVHKADPKKAKCRANVPALALVFVQLRYGAAL